MPGPTSYEPSLRSLIRDVLPHSSRVLTPDSALRRRISWPLLMRATGLGEIDGGELVLVPAARAREVLARLRELGEAGAAAVVVAGEVAASPASASGRAPALIAVPPDTEMRRLQGDIERYITRRRRELFVFEQQLHRLLIDVALGGASLDELLMAAAVELQRTLLLDRDGEMQVAPDRDFRLESGVLLHLRMSIREAGDVVEIRGPPRCLGVPVTVGDERRGIAILIAATDTVGDEDEAVVGALATACAIALAREQRTALPSLAELLTALSAPELGPERGGTATWTAIAVSDDLHAPAQLERALAAEFSARDVDFRAAREANALIALANAPERFPWETIVRGTGTRLGSETVRAGLGKTRLSADGAGQSAEEAIQALRRAGTQQIVSFAEIELSVLLASHDAWTEFARARLAGLERDGMAHGDLLRTLTTYLQCGRNAKLAATRLHVHRNTLLYRLRRIEEVLEVSLSDPDTLFELELTTRILALARSRRC